MQAGIPYTAATGEKLVNETVRTEQHPPQDQRHAGMHAMEVRDGRQGRFSLDENGFVFVEHKTAVRDFLDEAGAGLLPRGRRPDPAPLGAKRVHVFDHTLRSGNEAERERGCCASRCSRRTTITPTGRVQQGS